MQIALSIVVVGVLIFLAHLFAGIFGRTRIPDVLLLIVIGLLIGPVLGLAAPKQLGAVGPVFTTVTLVIILFEAGLGLDFDILRSSLRRAFRLASVSFFLTMISAGCAAIWLLHLSPPMAFMLGAIVGSTSPAIIVPLSRRLSLEDRTRTILVIESAVSDVLSVVVAIAFLEGYKLGNLQLGHMIGQIISTLLLAAILGVLCAFGWSALLRRVRSLENSVLATPAFVFILFGCVEMLGYSGYIAALAFGATLGNIETFHTYGWLKPFLSEEPITLNDTERVFLGEVVFLLKTFFFVYVGISVELANLPLILIGIAITAIVFLFRIPAVFLSVERSTPRSDVSFLAVMVPKGLAAVVLASIPLQQNVPGGATIREIVHIVVFTSITFTAVLTFLIERTRVGSVLRWLFRGYAPEVNPRPSLSPATAAD